MFGGHLYFCDALDYPVLDRWWSLPWVQSRLHYLHTMDSSDSPPRSTTPAELLGAKMADHCLLSLSWWQFWYNVFVGSTVCKMITPSLSFLCRIRQFLWHNRRQYDVTRVWQRCQQQSARHPHGSRGEETPRRGVANRTREGTKLIPANLRLLHIELNVTWKRHRSQMGSPFLQSGIHLQWQSRFKKLSLSRFLLPLLNKLSLNICVCYAIRSVSSS